MNSTHYFTDAYKQYAVFEGRTSRQAYWMFVLYFVIGSIALGIIDGLMFGQMGSMDGGLRRVGVLVGLYNLASFIPCLAIAVRRLHDVNVSGAYLLISLIPFIGPLILIFAYLIKPGTPGPNQYGPAPAETPRAAGMPPAAMPPASR